MTAAPDKVRPVNEPIEPCARCGKPPAICVCDRIKQTNTKLRIVILQHPQEDDALLGTANACEIWGRSALVHLFSRSPPGEQSTQRVRTVPLFRLSNYRGPSRCLLQGGRV